MPFVPALEPTAGTEQSVKNSSVLQFVPSPEGPRGGTAL